MSNLIEYFPKGYNPRDEQQIKMIKALEDALKSDKKFIVVNAATGIGKTFLAATLANYSKESCGDYDEYIQSYNAFKIGNEGQADDYPNYNAAVLTITKNLQDQYVKDFDVSVFKGKSNYHCDLDEDYDVEDAPCNHAPKQRLECWKCNRCSYYEARNKALTSQFGVYNYNVFLHIPEHVRRREFLICDEASELEDVLVDTYTYTVTYETVQKLLDDDFTKLLTEDSMDASKWLRSLCDAFEERVEDLKPHVENTKSKMHKKARVYTKQLKRHIEEINSVFSNWAIDGSERFSTEYIIELLAPDRSNKTVKEGVSFTPFRANQISRHLFNYGNRVILLSATFVDHEKKCRDLGIKKSDYEYIEMNSNFDPKRSPIKVCDHFPLNYSNMGVNLPKVIELVKDVCADHSHDKGLIHTVNFNITNQLSKTLNGPRFLVRGSGYDNQQLLQEHIDSSHPTVMISPSMSHGVDLKGDLGKFQIIVKVPYLPLNNKRIKRLSKEDYRWYINKTIEKLLQMCGRCTRCDTDEAVTYIVDGSVSKLFENNWKKLPKYIKDRII